jgi:hypothetical protein
MAAPPAIPRRGLFIGGGWREPALGRRIPVINPATEDTIGSSRHPIPFPSPLHPLPFRHIAFDAAASWYSYPAD